MTVSTAWHARIARGMLALALIAVGAASTAAPAQASGHQPVEQGLSAADAMQRLRSQPARIALGERLVDQLGGRAAGFWLDQANDSVVVNVLDERAAAQVRKAGAVAKVVAHSAAALDSARDRLEKLLPAHSSVGVDTAANQVVVRIGSAAAASPELRDAVNELGSAVRVERFDGALRPMVIGGDAIVGNSGIRCTLGFNTTGGTAVTAGHCTAAVSHWYVNGQYFGPSVSSNFPGGDYGLIRNDGGLPQPGEVGCCGFTQDITGAVYPYYGMYVCKIGSTTGLTCGYVYATGVTVCYAQGCVSNLAQTDAYAAPGDSGGPVFSGSNAVGIISGGGGGWTFFYPIVDVLNAYGIWVY